MLMGGNDCHVLYKEDFEDRVADGWIEETPCRWSIVCDEGDWSYFLHTTCYERGEVSVLVTHTFSDFKLSLWAKSPENLCCNPYADYGITFCAGGGTFYCMRFDACNRNNTLFKTGVEVGCYNGPTIADNQYHHIVISKKCGDIKVYFDDGLIISYCDPCPIPDGLIIIGSWNDAVYFDDIVVTGPEGPHFPTTIWSENFEGGFPRSTWKVCDENSCNGRDYWDNQRVWDGARVREGDQSCYCADISDVPGQKYDDNMLAYFRTKCGIDLSGYSNVKLSFSIWYDTENEVDYVRRYYSSDGDDWDLGCQWTGKSCGWKDYTIELNDFNTYWMKFEFYSNHCNHCYEGAYVDNIAITGTPCQSLAKANAREPYEELVENETTALMNLMKELPINESPADEFENTALPETFTLEQNYPNPFNPETQISFTLPELEVVQLDIFNLKGQLVRTLVNCEMQAGRHAVRWDGKDSAGNQVAGGIYLSILRAGEYEAHRKMTLLK